jgi:hypothetical protein
LKRGFDCYVLRGRHFLRFMWGWLEMVLEWTPLSPLR